MSESTLVRVGAVADFETRDRLFAVVDGEELCVFQRPDGFRAYVNRCPHVGGPVCQGRTVPRVVSVIDENRVHVEDVFDHSQLHIACPWHGWEFNVDTGRSVINRRVRLRAYEVVEEDGSLYVVA